MVEIVCLEVSGVIALSIEPIDDRVFLHLGLLLVLGVGALVTNLVLTSSCCIVSLLKAKCEVGLP